MQWNISVEGLAVVTTYTVASISMRGNFYRDKVLLFSFNHVAEAGTSCVYGRLKTLVSSDGAFGL